MVVVKSTEGWVFGGYASESWNSTNVFFGSIECFLFTLTNPHSIPPTKYLPQRRYYLYGCPSYGPAFGDGHDFYISDNSNSNNYSYACLSCSYADTTGKGDKTFTGANRFTCQDIEVFVMN